jgi:opacity protein-like surface antigen
MKHVLSVAALSVFAISAPVVAQAQTAAPTGFYGTLGYAGTGYSGYDVGAIQGRLGYRFNNWLGAEGEVSGGVKDDSKAIAPGVDAKFKLDHQEAIYGVGFIPLSPQLDLLGRVGYGHSKAEAEIPGAKLTQAADSWNFGAGAQYHFDGKNGVRADYTREELQRSGGGGANVWSAAYSRRF